MGSRSTPVPSRVFAKIGAETSHVKPTDHSQPRQRDTETKAEGCCILQSDFSNAVADGHYTYNFERPHEALKNRTPSELWENSPRSYPERLPLPQYPSHFEVRRISNSGTFKFGAERFFLGRVLSEDYVGLGRLVMKRRQRARPEPRRSVENTAAGNHSQRVRVIVRAR